MHISWSVSSQPSKVKSVLYLLKQWKKCQIILHFRDNMLNEVGFADEIVSFGKIPNAPLTRKVTLNINSSYFSCFA